MASPSTQQLINISEIRDDVVVLKNGSLRSVVEISAINFELRSEEEQVAIIQNFQRFLNSMDFPIQLVVSSRKLEIDGYLSLIEEKTDSLDELLKIQASEYSRFVKELSSLANIMVKKFYIVVPFYVFDNPQAVGIKDALKSMIRTSPKTVDFTNEQFETYRNQLMQRTELIFDGLIGLGLKTKIVSNDELKKLFFSLYNPQ